MVDWKLLQVIFLCVLPWVELRGAIPLGIAYNYSVPHIFLGCVIIDILLIPLIFLFLDFVIPIITKIDFIDRVYQYAINRARRNYKKYEKYEIIGLALFVGIPFPGTGVYSGTAIAYIFGLERKKAFVSIAFGALIAGIIVTMIAVGVFSIF
ncbi:MAG: small multi-drug export protein [Methanomicrobia archaeon]|nr:small multi-drug export protein [Methanomicrobia archaeon]MCK4637438.1 small multi-drug export protein [Methanomicrobia archaeon]